MSHESLISLLNALYDYTLNDENISMGSHHYIVIGKSLDKLNADEIATASAKGWTLVG